MDAVVLLQLQQPVAWMVAQGNYDIISAVQSELQIKWVSLGLCILSSVSDNHKGYSSSSNSHQRCPHGRIA